jgi:hypothetical protein
MLRPYHIVIIGNSPACRSGDMPDAHAERTANSTTSHDSAFELRSPEVRYVDMHQHKSRTMGHQFAGRNGVKTQRCDQKATCGDPGRSADRRYSGHRGISAERDHSQRSRVHVIGEL